MIAAAIVKLDDFFERVKSAVVHVRRVKLDVSQIRSFEFSIILRQSRLRSASQVFVHGANADVMEIVVGEKRVGVTEITLLRAEQHTSHIFLRR